MKRTRSNERFIMLYYNCLNDGPSWSIWFSGKGDPYWLTKLVKMSQEVLSLQEKHPNQWNSAKEIAKALGVPATYICTALKALRKSGLIAFQKVPMGKKKKPTFQYKFKWWMSMGQQDIYEFLQEHPNEWFTSGEIGDALNLSIGSVSVSLKRLRDTDEVRYQRTKGSGRTPYRYMFIEWF